MLFDKETREIEFMINENEGSFIVEISINWSANIVCS